MNIKDKLEKQVEQDLKDKGEVRIDANTIETMTKKEAVKDKKESELNVDTTVKLSDKVKQDSTLIAADKKTTAEAMAQELGSAKEATEAQQKVMVDVTGMKKDITDNIVITAAEKHIFLDTLIENERFVLPFKLFNGQYTGELRSRTQAETFAIFQQINKELRNGQLDSQLCYSMRLRSMLFAAQIKRLNNVEYTELQEPLLSVADGENVIPPGWLVQAAKWDNTGDGFIKVLLSELCTFEYKYLTMLEHAQDQNFWKTELHI